MSSINHNRRAYEAAIAALGAEVAENRDDEADIDKATAALTRILRRRHTTTSDAVPLEDDVRPDGLHMPKGNRKGEYAGLSIGDAAVLCLERSAEAMTLRQMIDAIEAGGFEMTSNRPESSLSTALNRREGNHADAIHVARGKWKHRCHLTPAEQAAQEHKERTLRGMQKAKARGVRLGSPPKLDAPKVEEMFRQGKSVAEIAHHFGVSKSALYNKFDAEAISKLRAEAPSNTEDGTSRLRVVGGGNVGT